MEMILKRNRWLYLLALASVSQLAHAHGEEVLTSIYAELVSIAICFTSLFILRRARPFRVIGGAACIVGVVVGNWAVSGLPYMQYRSLITAVGFIVPMAATVLALYVSRLIASRNS